MMRKIYLHFVSVFSAVLVKCFSALRLQLFIYLLLSIVSAL